LGTPRRAVIGYDTGRLSMVLAVLEARVGLQFSGCDVYLNIAGGIRINEPAADLAVAAALVSSLNNVAAPADAVFFGEIGLAGEVRQVPQPDVRLKEASKLGFGKAIIPRRKAVREGRKPDPLEVSELAHLQDLADLLREQGGPRRAIA
jgi:DNA repair protein RadA/Sms